MKAHPINKTAPAPPPVPSFLYSDSPSRAATGNFIMIPCNAAVGTCMIPYNAAAGKPMMVCHGTWMQPSHPERMRLEREMEIEREVGEDKRPDSNPPSGRVFAMASPLWSSLNLACLLAVSPSSSLNLASDKNATLVRSAGTRRAGGRDQFTCASLDEELDGAGVTPSCGLHQRSLPVRTSSIHASSAREEEADERLVTPR